MRICILDGGLLSRSDSPSEVTVSRLHPSPPTTWCRSFPTSQTGPIYIRVEGNGGEDPHPRQMLPSLQSRRRKCVSCDSFFRGCVSSLFTLWYWSAEKKGRRKVFLSTMGVVGGVRRKPHNHSPLTDTFVGVGEKMGLFWLRNRKGVSMRGGGATLELSLQW